jgi:hypothetical protein
MDSFTSETTKSRDENLAKEISSAVERLPDDIVRCTRVNGSFYRCNWWAAERTDGYDNPMMKAGQVGTTHRIRKSEFLSVTRSADGLSIVVVK